MNGIFISYRRDDSAGYAGRLYDRLVGHFGADRVFMDVEHIEPGTDFVVAIEKAVESCHVLIALIGDEWLNIADAQGRRRLDDPHDFIRLETSAALKRNIRVVPVLLDGAPMPPMDALPDDLKSLVRRQAVELTHKQWEATSGELIRTLEKILRDTPAPAVEAPPPKPPPAQRPPAWRLPAIGVALLALIAAVALLWPASPQPPAAPPPSSAPGTPPPASTATAPEAAMPTTEAKIPAQLAATTSILDFGTLFSGGRKSDTFTVGNTGQMDEPVSAQLDGTDADQFQIIADTCGAGLRAASYCNYSVLYRPQAAGTHRARLLLSTSASALQIDLAGISTPAPAAEQAPEPAPASIAKPQIQHLDAAPQDGGTRLCYRVQGAERVTITPVGGTPSDPASGCVTVPLSGPTTLTFVAQNAAGRVSRTLRAAPAAPAVAAAATTSATDSALPAPGDTWVYRLRGKWANSPKRTLSVRVDKLENALIYETMTLDEPGPRAGGTRRSRPDAPAFVDWTWLGWEFAPWLGTSDGLREARWSDLKPPAMGNNWGDWRASGRVEGREDVTVPAGSFRAVKVQVLAQRRQTGSRIQADIEPTQVLLTVWYSPKAKRYVKMERIVKAANSAEIERDQIELLRYDTR